MNAPAGDTLDAADIASRLVPPLRGPVHVFGSLPSTSTHLLALARDGAPEGTIVVAGEQTAGRGRFNRTWHSAPGLGLWLSLLLRPRVPPASVASVTLVAGLAVADAVDAACGAPGTARLKWPNDVWVHGRKLAGILAETPGRTPPQPAAGAHPGDAIDPAPPLVLGIGVNVHHAEADFPDELRAKATSLRLASRPGSAPAAPAAGHVAGMETLGRSALLASIVNAFAARYETWLVSGLEPFVPEWDRRALWLGERIRLTAGGRVHRGVALGLASSGGLRVATPAGEEEVLLAGEVEADPVP